MRTLLVCFVLVLAVPDRAGAQQREAASARAIASRTLSDARIREAARKAALKQEKEAQARRARAKPHADKAVAFHRAGLVDAAEGALKDALEQDPAYPIPLELRGLKARTMPAGMRTAEQLAAAGFYDEAKQEIEKTLRANPSSHVPAHLQYLLGDPTRPINDWFTLRATPAAATLATLALLVLLAVLIGRRAVLWWRQPPPRLYLEPFTSDGVELQIAKTVREIADEALRQSRTATGAAADRITTGPLEPIEVPNALVTANASAASLAALLSTAAKWLLRIDQIAVPGTLHAPGVFGAGLSLKIVHKKHVLASVTIWEADYLCGTPLPATTCQSYYGLVEPSIIWLQYELTERYDKKRKPKGKPKIPWTAGLPTSMRLRKEWRERRGGCALLGATNWRSYALFRTGARAQRRGHQDLAAKLYEQALLADPRNRAARTNLGLLLSPTTPRPAALEAGATDAEQRAHAKELSDRVAPALLHLKRARAETPAGVTEPNSILASYMIASLLSEAGSPEALQEADALVKMIRDGLPANGQSGPLHDYLIEMRAPAFVMWAAMLPEARRGEGDVALAEIDKDAPSAELQYNLACLESLRGNHTEALRRLEWALRCNIAYVSQASIDPSLQGVRDDPGTAGRFLEVTSAPAAVPPPPAMSDLHALDVVRPGADRLHVAGVRSAAELVIAASTLLGRNKLADAAGVSVDAVMRWAEVAEFLRFGIPPAHANVLARGGVDRITRLSASSPADVLRVFAAFATAQEEPAPTMEQVTQWLLAAQDSPAIT